MRAALPLIALTALAACGGQDAAKQQGPAFEKVLPGSASDAMLPYDTASSTPPLAPETLESPDETTSGSRRVRPASGDEATAPEAQPT